MKKNLIWFVHADHKISDLTQRIDLGNVNLEGERGV